MKNEVNVGDVMAAPVGEREAFEAWCAQEMGVPVDDVIGAEGDDLFAAYQAGAAYQRQSGVVMADVSAMAKVLSDRAADACNIDRTDNWAMYGQEYIDDVQAMLEVARLNGGHHE